MLPQFDERDHLENRAQDNCNMSAGEILAVVIAALTLLVATIPLFRCSRFRRWVSSSTSSFVKVYSPPLVLQKPTQIFILNLAILSRKPSALPLQTLCRQLLLQQRTQVPSQLPRFPRLALSSFIMTILMPASLASVLMPSYTAKTVPLGQTVERHKQRSH